MKAVDITLLTRKEYDKCRHLLTTGRSRGWIAIGNFGEVVVMDERLDWKSIAEGYAYSGNYDMLPVVICDTIPYPPGSKIEFGGSRWIVISKTKIFADTPIGQCRPVSAIRSLPQGEPKVSDTKCIPFIRNWFAKHKKDPMYVLGKNKKTLI